MLTIKDVQDVLFTIEEIKFFSVTGAPLNYDGRDKSIYFVISFDYEKDWEYGILENSRYLRFLIDDKTEKIEHFSGGYGLPTFRKSLCRSKDELKKKLEIYISKC